MAITQERMLKLLAESQKLVDCLDIYRLEMTTLMHQLSTGKETVSGAVNFLHSVLTLNPIPSREATVVEQYHFRKWKRHNDRERAKKQGKRLDRITRQASTTDSDAVQEQMRRAGVTGLPSNAKEFFAPNPSGKEIKVITTPDYSGVDDEVERALAELEAQNAGQVE